MATLRLFGPARVKAGEARAELAGRTVGQVLEAAEVRYGEPFARVVASSQIWVNGVAATTEDPVTDEDEVAVIPPVSGG